MWPFAMADDSWKRCTCIPRTIIFFNRLLCLAKLGVGFPRQVLRHLGIGVPPFENSFSVCGYDASNEKPSGKKLFGKSVFVRH